MIGGGIDAAYDFEGGTLQGWTPTACEGIGDHIGLAPFSDYTILDPCQCRLDGMILEMHNNQGDEGRHPVRQHQQARSPICWFGDTDPKAIFMEFDIYAEMPQENACMIRPGWVYYPWTCEVTGEIGWSDRVGQNRFDFFGNNPLCARMRYGGTEVGTGSPVPADAIAVIAILELLSDADAFGIDCPSGITNATPLFDNIKVGRTEGALAPAIGFDVGTQFQDVGSFPSDLFDPRAPGPANIVANKYFDSIPLTRPDECGDSLVVIGPVPDYGDPESRWEAQMWWRVAKRAPFQSDVADGAPTGYAIWKERVADDVLGDPDLLDRPDHPHFTMGLMDTAQVGYVVQRYKFCSYFREDDDDFRGENFDGSNPETEMIWGDVLYPGTRIDYFITSNYAHTPNELNYLPDTLGGFFHEFEILPGLRTAYVPDCGGIGFDSCVFQPATLYIDAYNRGAQFFIENALRTVLNGKEPCGSESGCPIPKDRNWDRYDYLDAESSWNNPLERGPVPGSNNGMTLNQILGYRTILLNTGRFGRGGMADQDFRLFQEWLIAPECDANVNRQVFAANGDQIGELMEQPDGWDLQYGLSFLNQTLGAILACEAFHGLNENPACAPPDSSYCVRLLAVDGGPFDSEIDIDAYGSYCPNLHSFNVFDLSGGTGNRTYHAEDSGKEMAFAQVVNEDLSPGGNYRTILDGVSWHHMTERDGGAYGLGRCPRDAASIFDATSSAIASALKWGFDVESVDDIPKLANAASLADCQGTYDLPADLAEERSRPLVNRLYQNRPNPFNPRTLIRFSLAREGPVEVSVYDLSGWLVRTLVDGRAKAGLNAVEWDGGDDAGHRVGSGVYWTQMKTGSSRSNKQMVILK